MTGRYPTHRCGEHATRHGQQVSDDGPPLQLLTVPSVKGWRSWGAYRWLSLAAKACAHGSFGTPPHAASVVGEVLAWGSMQSRSSVARLAGQQIDAWREKHSAQYLDALAEADREGQVVWGLSSVWDAVRAQNVARLWVERDYRSPGNLVDGGTRLVLSDHQGHGVISDVVDLVIERAAGRRSR